MSLTSGTRIGPYEVAAQIGVGGMGEVYRATDTKLKRLVALKILPAAVADDPDRLARFQREAEVLASLNHPNIAQIYGLEDAGGVRALVMELVDGPTLADRIAQGAVPLHEARAIGIQIADALEAAHEQGIVHRDLKPANVKVRPDGTVKVLDFGLAKAMEPASAVGGPAGQAQSLSPTMLPTITTPAMTQAGMILGTAAYMSPEQAKGRPADKRSDVWAFGVVLFEMLTGRRAFDGEDMVDVLGAVARLEPDWTALPPAVPVPIRTLLQDCLTKNRSQRTADIASALFVLRHLPALSTASGTAAAGSGTHARTGPRVAMALAAAALLGAAAATLIPWRAGPSATAGDTTTTHVSVPLPPGDQVDVSMDAQTLALSPDGRTLVYVGMHEGRRQLWVRGLASRVPAPLDGTEGAQTPFFSPDGQWLGFFADNKLKKVAVAGGGIRTLAAAGNARGGTWGQDDTIYFASSVLDGIKRVPAAGGDVAPVTTLDRTTKGEISHRWPQILPGGQALLYTVWSGPGADEKWIEAMVLATGERRTLVRGATTGRYVPSGHLVYGDTRADQLLAVPMNLGRLEVAETAPIRVGQEARVGGEGAHFDVSASGTLALVSGNRQRTARRLVWVDRRGTVETLPIPARQYESVALSPDRRRVAVSINADRNELWVHDFERRTTTKLLTGDGSGQAPVWSPDGRRVAYRATRAGSRNAFWIDIGGGSSEERLTTNPDTETPGSFTPDGRWLLTSRTSQDAASDIWASPTQGGEPRRLIGGEGDQRAPQVSSDGRWLAYSSVESGRSEIYVQPFPSLDAKWLISGDGGIEPRWSPDGQELFYRSGDRVMAVAVATRGAFSAGRPQPLFSGHGFPAPTNSTGYDVSEDGQRFLMAEPVEPDRPITTIEVVLNWFQELRRLAPVP